MREDNERGSDSRSLNSTCTCIGPIYDFYKISVEFRQDYQCPWHRLRMYPLVHQLHSPKYLWMRCQLFFYKENKLNGYLLLPSLTLLSPLSLWLQGRPSVFLLCSLSLSLSLSLALRLRDILAQMLFNLFFLWVFFLAVTFIVPT